jgi:tyrosinase
MRNHTGLLGHAAMLILLSGCTGKEEPDKTDDTDLPTGTDTIDDTTDDTADTTSGLRVRKNASALTEQEKADFTAAILALKASPPPAGIEAIVVPRKDGGGDIVMEIPNWYDMFVVFHQASVMYAKNLQDGNGVAHHNPAFPPWHRKLLLDYEEALRTVSGKDITLPYWDWTEQTSTDAVFSPDLMGSAGDPDCEPDCAYAVVDGPFAKGEWELEVPTLMPDYVDQHPWTWIVRAIGVYETVSYTVTLPTSEEVTTAIGIDTYDSEPYNMGADRMSSFRNYLEGFDPDTSPQQYMHNIGHDWVSGGWIDGEDSYVGTLEPLDISPSDPVFFMYYCNVDRIWASWQVAKEGRMDAYEPTSHPQQGWNRDDEMYPYLLFTDVPEVGAANTPADFLDFESLGYTYDAMVLGK